MKMIDKITALVLFKQNLFLLKFQLLLADVIVLLFIAIKTELRQILSSRFK